MATTTVKAARTDMPPPELPPSVRKDQQVVVVAVAGSAVAAAAAPAAQGAERDKGPVCVGTTEQLWSMLSQHQPPPPMPIRRSLLNMLQAQEGEMSEKKSRPPDEGASSFVFDDPSFSRCGSFASSLCSESADSQQQQEPGAAPRYQSKLMKIPLSLSRSCLNISQVNSQLHRLATVAPKSALGSARSDSFGTDFGISGPVTLALKNPSCTSANSYPMDFDLEVKSPEAPASDPSDPCLGSFRLTPDEVAAICNPVICNNAGYQMFAKMFGMPARPQMADDYRKLIALGPVTNRRVALQIQNDVFRTFRGSTEFDLRAHERELYRVLHAYARKVEETRPHLSMYIQGTNALAAVLIIDLPEHYALEVLLGIADQVPSYFAPEIPGVNQATMIAQRIIELVDPQLFKFMSKKGFQHQLLSKYVLSLGSVSRPISSVMRLWLLLCDIGFKYMPVVTALHVIRNGDKIYESNKNFGKVLSNLPLEEGVLQSILSSFSNLSIPPELEKELDSHRTREVVVISDDSASDSESVLGYDWGCGGASTQPAPKQPRRQPPRALLLPSSQPPSLQRSPHVAPSQPPSTPPSSAPASTVGSSPGQLPSLRRSEVPAVSWVDKHKPSTAESLAVNPKKVAEVREWLGRAMVQAKARRAGRVGAAWILVLRGPSGAGKTALVRALCSEARAELQEYSESPSTSRRGLDGAVSDYESPLRGFGEWLSRASRSLSLFSSAREKLLLLEDLPNVVPQALQDAKALFERFLRESMFPMVVVVSEALSSVDGLTPMQSMIARELVAYPGVMEIKINPVAQRTLEKALAAIAQEEGFNLSPASLSDIAEQSAGDIRCAINALQFSCTGASHAIPFVKKTRKSKGGESKTVSFGSRDLSISLFHAVGKVLYCKRDPSGHLESSPQSIVDSCHTRSSTLLSFVHENCPPFFVDLDDLANAADSLSTADLMPQRRRSGGVEDQSDEYFSFVGLYGFMCSNKHASEVPKQWRSVTKPRFGEAMRTADLHADMFDDIPRRVQGVGAESDLPRWLLDRPDTRLQVVPFLGKIPAAQGDNWIDRHFVMQVCKYGQAQNGAMMQEDDLLQIQHDEVL
eukprot:m51a1_g9202 putative cell cycle checkpoint protein Rad17 (1091) ;mRNA; f:111193-116117